MMTSRSSGFLFGLVGCCLGLLLAACSSAAGTPTTVAPTATRQGIGSALVAEIERVAREHGLTHLHLDSSITAEAFYRALGYTVEERGELVL